MVRHALSSRQIDTLRRLFEDAYRLYPGMQHVIACTPDDFLPRGPRVADAESRSAYQIYIWRTRDSPLPRGAGTTSAEGQPVPEFLPAASQAISNWGGGAHG